MHVQNSFDLLVTQQFIQYNVLQQQQQKDYNFICKQQHTGIHFDIGYAYYSIIIIIIIIIIIPTFRYSS